MRTYTRIVRVIHRKHFFEDLAGSRFRPARAVQSIVFSVAALSESSSTSGCGDRPSLVFDSMGLEARVICKRSMRLWYGALPSQSCLSRLSESVNHTHRRSTWYVDVLGSLVNLSGTSLAEQEDLCECFLASWRNDEVGAFVWTVCEMADRRPNGVDRYTSHVIYLMQFAQP